MTSRIWFVRHGESVANASGFLAGHHDSPLTPRGEAQARALAPALAALAPERLVASDLRRAWGTAALAWPADQPPLERTAALRERHLGDWERRDHASLRATGDNAALLSWRGTPPRGESHEMLARRVLTWLAEHDDGRRTVLFVHGGLIRAVVGLIDGTPHDRIGQWKVKNTEIVARSTPPERWAELLAALGPS